MTAPLSNDFLVPEAAIVARLQARLAGLQPAVHVLTAADLEGVQEAVQLVPAVHVVWGGFGTLQSRSDGTMAELQHTWLVIAVVRNVRDTRSGGAARAEAGALIARAGGALMGFRAPNTTGPMTLAPKSPAAGFRAGCMYLPLAFNVRTIFKATFTD